MRNNAEAPTVSHEPKQEGDVFGISYPIIQKISRLQTVTLFFFISTVIFVLSHIFPYHAALEIAKLVTGFISIVLIPGWLFSDVFLPRTVQGLGVTILGGLLLTVIEIQVLFLTSLLLQVKIPLLFWIVLSQTAFAGLCLLHFYRSQVTQVSSGALSLGNPTLLPIIAIAIIFRLVLAFLSAESIGVDATLFADYARAMMDGSFESAVMNDAAVIPISGGADYLIHQGYVYLAAVSFLLITPGIAGPVAILIVIGIVLLLLAYSIAAHYFGAQAGVWVTGILALHPLFVFHSCVGYGPEIVSVVIILFASLIMIKSEEKTPTLLLFIGVLLGLVDVIWYANIYVLSVVLPVTFVVLRYFSRGESLRFSLLLPLVLVSLVSLRDVPLYFVIWTVIFAILIASRHLMPSFNLYRYTPLYLGLFITLVAWRLPVQISYILREIVPTPVTNILPAILQPVTIELVVTFTVFFIFHLTPTLAALVVWSLFKGEEKISSIALMVIGFVSAAGTLKTLGMRSDGPLEFFYLYSDSRFFIFLTLAFAISLGSLFMVLERNKDRRIKLGLPLIGTVQFGRRDGMMVALILIGFVPGYLVMPSGLALIDFETRYGWRDLDNIVEPLGNESTIFLLNRAREFAWFTGKRAAVLKYSQSWLDPVNASLQTLAMRNEYNAEYLIWDLYNAEKWRTFEFLLNDSMNVGSQVLLDVSRAVYVSSLNSTGLTRSLRLVAETPVNEINRFSRVYAFDNAIFERTQNISLLSEGWETTKQGTLTASAEGVQLAIANGENSTTVRRVTSFDLGFEIEAGYMLFQIEDTDGVLSSLDIWSSSGELLRVAEQIGVNLYYCPFGSVDVGEIRLTIEGEPGSEVLIRSISIWESSE